jgi:hypothetical protein
LGCLSQFQVLVNGALDDRATEGDLVLRQAQRRQPQNLTDLAHGQSLFRQTDSPCFKQNQIALFDVQRRSVFVPT